MITPEKKQRILELLTAGQRQEAIHYAEGAFNVNAQEAERLIESLETGTKPGWRIDPGTIVGRTFSFIGAIFLAVVVALYWNDMKSSRGRIKIPGKVVRLEYNQGSGAVPVIHYRYLGKEREFVGTISSSPPAFDVGEEVSLLVDSNNPEDVMIDSFLERYFLILIFGILGIVFGGVGLLVLRFFT